MSKKNLAKGVTWDLTSMYSGIDDPQIQIDKDSLLNFASEFTKKYKGKINTSDITPEKYKEILDEMISADELLFKVEKYVGLSQATDVLNEDISSLNHKIEELHSKYYAELSWFSLERKQWSEEKAQEMIKSSVLAKFKHMHSQERLFIPYVLSEKEESILNRFSPVGSSALLRLYEKLADSLKFKLTIDGGEKELNLSEISEISRKHKDRKLRELASEAILNKVIKYETTNSLILNSLLTDSKISDEVRGFEYPEHATYLSNETPKEIVDGMIKEVSSRFGLVEKYYLAKKKALGFDELYSWDRSIEIYPEVSREFTWTEAQSTVLAAFEKFDPDFAKLAKEFFDKKWIDAQLSENKGAGAFCSFGSPKSNPYVYVNFTGNIEDVFTLAHELGHGIHSILSQDQSLYEFWPSIATAEIASVFAESLVFDYLYENLESKEEKINILGNKIEESIGTVFIQTGFHLFEQETHKHMREKGELKIQDFNSIFKKNNEGIYGTSVKFSDNSQIRWALISHFFNYDFYVYTYAFGELLTTSLYANYKKGGEDFVKNYKKGLSLGGSMSPQDITKEMGVDIHQPDFWKSGLDVLENYIKEYEKLISN